MIVITGGAGFIGSNLAAALTARGERVAICDHLGQGDKWRNIAKLELEDIVPPDQILQRASVPAGGPSPAERQGKRFAARATNTAAAVFVCVVGAEWPQRTGAARTDVPLQQRDLGGASGTESGNQTAVVWIQRRFTGATVGRINQVQDGAGR